MMNNNKHEQWVEISKEHNEELIVQFYNPRVGNYWEFPFNEALEVLEQAKKRLLERKFPKNWSWE